MFNAAHPNVRLFITHGGLLSLLEAVSRAVPLIGIPVYADQGLNMERAVSSGYGIIIDYYNVSTQSLTWAIQEMLQSPKYVLLF
jgi:glucuronosyltransferase